MQFNLKSKITDHSIDLNSLAERVIVGPQEEVLRTIESFNHTFNSDIRCTKKFRWEPGFYKKLNALQIKAMSLDKFPKSVKSAFNKVANNDWYFRRLREKTRNIDTMLYRLRSNNMMFQDNTDAVTEQTAAWFNSIMSTAEVMNAADNGYLFEIYHAMCYELNKDYITAFKLDGASNWHILSRGIFPNIYEHIVVIFTMALSTAILDISALGFLKLGAQPPTTEWGAILAENLGLIYLAPWTVGLPGVLLFLAVLSTNLVGDGLRQVLKARKAD